MPLQNFVDGGLPTIKAAWLNAVDAFYFTLFNSATTAAAARTALGSTTVGDAVFIAANAAAGRTALGVDATGVNLPLAGGTMTGAILMSGAAVNDAITTVASGTSTTAAAIWSGNRVIDFTGTSMITGFAAAPVAGAQRLLICAGACGFQSGANVTIRGFPTAKQVRMRANAFVLVTALTTTTFLLEYSLYGTATLTATGMSGITADVEYTVVNGMVSAYHAGFIGTSTTTAFTITGYPAEITPTADRAFYNLTIADNTSTSYAGYGVLSNASVLTLYKTPASASTDWTASGTKALYVKQWNYRL